MLGVTVIDCETRRILASLSSQLSNDSSISFVLHTHLINNGNIEIKISASNKFCDDLLILAHQIYSVQNLGKLSSVIRNTLVDHKVPILKLGPVDSQFYAFDARNIKPWFDSENPQFYINSCLDTQKITEKTAKQLTQFINDGYIILEDLIDIDLINQINTDLDEAINEKWQGYSPLSSQRLEGLHKRFNSINNLWLYPKILDILKLIFDENIVPCQTLSYICGSQQDVHQDTIHLTSFPAGYMCGVWVALEDVKPGSGELFYYPKSHKLERIYMEQANCPKVQHGDWSQFAQTVLREWQSLINQSGLEQLKFYPKKGTVLIWHENLMHGGLKRVDMSLTRRSIVSHYFASGALIYFDSTGLIPCLNLSL